MVLSDSNQFVENILIKVGCSDVVSITICKQWKNFQLNRLFRSNHIA